VHVHAVAVALRADAARGAALCFDLTDGSLALCQAAGPSELRVDLAASALELSEVAGARGGGGGVPILAVARAAGGALPLLVEGALFISIVHHLPFILLFAHNSFV
jgi:hypothetical protein